MPAAINYAAYDDATEDFKSAATENIWGIFTESPFHGFRTQFSVWKTALDTAQAASPVDQKTVNKLQFLVRKCQEVAEESGRGGRR